MNLGARFARPACAPARARRERSKRAPLLDRETRKLQSLTTRNKKKYPVYTDYITGEDMNEPATTTMIFRIDADLKKAFEMSAKARDLTASQLIRKYIRHEVDQFMQKNAQGALDLEDRPTPTPSVKKPAKGQKMASLSQARRGKA